MSGGINVEVRDSHKIVRGTKERDEVWIFEGAKSNRVYTFDKEDTIRVNGDRNKIFSGHGADIVVLYAGAKSNTVKSGSGADDIWISNTSRFNVVHSSPDNDRLYAYEDSADEYRVFYASE